MVCRIAASLAYETFIRPFYLRHIPQTVIVILKSIIELNGIHAFKYFSLYHATKVAIIFRLGASTAYTYKYICDEPGLSELYEPQHKHCTRHHRNSFGGVKKLFVIPI